MALTDENGGMNTTMLVSPTNAGIGQPYPIYMGGGNGGNSGGFDNGNGWWIILLFILLASGNWGGNNNGGGGGAFGGQPIIVNDGNNGSYVQRGFDQAAIMGGINGVQTGIYNLSTQLCNGFSDVQQSLCSGFAGVNSAVSNGFAQAEIANNTRQIANMQTAFAAQTAMSQGFNQLGSQFADCCCENRLANCQTQNIIQNEGNATRFADANNTRDIIQSQSNGTQAILDKLCQLELDGKNDRIADLERQLTMANLAASQTAQTARLLDNNNAQTASLLRDNAAQTVALEQYLNPTPIPAYIVQNPNCCPQNNCGCGNF